MNIPPVQRRSLKKARVPKHGLLAVLGVICLLQAGCLGLASQLMHVAGMDLIPAEYDGLDGQTVAVVTMTDSSQYTNDAAARELSRRVGIVLSTKCDDVALVREDAIAEYRDVHGYDSTDYHGIGKETGADKVLAIELTNLRLRDGQTLFRGRSDVYLQVIDVETGNIMFRKTLDEYTYPKNAGQHSGETTESKFRKLYLNMLAMEIGRAFHRYDGTDRIALDSKIASQ